MSAQPSYLGVATAGWVAALKSSDSLERRLAAHALAEIGHMAPEAVPPLTEALRDSESFVRVWAAAALARVEPEHPDVLPARRSGERPAACNRPHRTLSSARSFLCSSCDYRRSREA